MRGLTLLIASEFPTWGQSVNTLVAVLFRAALARAGEIGRAGLEEDLTPQDADTVGSEA